MYCRIRVGRSKIPVPYNFMYHGSYEPHYLYLWVTEPPGFGLQKMLAEEDEEVGIIDIPEAQLIFGHAIKLPREEYEVIKHVMIPDKDPPRVKKNDDRGMP